MERGALLFGKLPRPHGQLARRPNILRRLLMLRWSGETSTSGGKARGASMAQKADSERKKREGSQSKKDHRINGISLTKM